MNIYEMLSRDNYLTVNKVLMKAVGVCGAVLISELCYRRQYLARQNKLTEDGYFYATIADIEEETTFSEYEQRKILGELQEKGIVTVERRGLPAKRYIYLHEEALQKIMGCAEQDLKNLKDKTLKPSGLNNNNITNNNTVSKDTVLDTAGCPDNAVSPKTSQSVSGKLFSSEKPKTKKTSIQKINSFISTCQREAIKKEFSQEVLVVLDKYFIMLAEMNCMLPAVSIAEQLSWLVKVSADKQVEVVKNTISRGWKSLQYEAQASISPKSFDKYKSSFLDTSTPGTFTATPEELKNGDWKNDIPEDHIF